MDSEKFSKQENWLIHQSLFLDLLIGQVSTDSKPNLSVLCAFQRTSQYVNLLPLWKKGKQNS